MDLLANAKSLLERVSDYISNLEIFSQGGPLWPKVLGLGVVFYITNRLYRRFTRKSVAGEVVLVTGGASGIGRLVAKRLSKLGSTVVIWDVNQKGMDEVANEIKAEKRAVHTYRVDLAQREEIYKAAEKVKAEVGPVTILINNAGIVSGKQILDPNFSDERAMLTMKINTEAHFWTVRSFVLDMAKNNHGHVVTIASAGGISAVAGLSDYCASKFAAIGFDEGLRLEFQKQNLNGCHTTCVCPFYIDTGMFEGVKSRFSWFLPILKPDYVADRIVDGILENSNYVYLPGHVTLAYFMKFFFPTQLTDSLGKLLGLNNSMDEFVGRK